MIPDKNIRCHRAGFAKTCQSIVTKGQCRLWTQIMGTHPQTGEQMNKWGCADEFLPMLLIENSQQQRQTAAAVESLRNETVSRQDAALERMNGTVLPRS